jgi:hypothetical protein
MAASIATEEEEKLEEMHSLLVCPTCTGSLIALLVLGSAISSADTNIRIVNAVVEVTYLLTYGAEPFLRSH